MLSNSFKIFTLFGFDIKLDPSWFFIAAFIVWSLLVGYFPSAAEGQGQTKHLILAIFGMFGFFASLILHELSHGLVARWMGVHFKSVTLFVFGGVAELETEPKTAGSEFWIALAGPAISLALAFGFWFLSRVASAAQVADAMVSLLQFLSTVNLGLAIFNLLPAFPLGGGRVYRAIVWKHSGDFLGATHRASGLSTLFAYVLIAVGILVVFGGQQIVGLWQVIIGLLLLSATNIAYQRAVTCAAFKDKIVAVMMTRNSFTASPDQTLSELVHLIMLRHRIGFVPVVEDGVLLGYVDSDIVGGIDRENWSGTQVGDVYVALDDTNSISPQASAYGVLEHMLQAERRKLLVVDDHHLLGIIALSDLMTYLRVLQDVGAPFAPAAPP